MEDILKPVMDEGEKVLWTGRPESFETMDATNKNHIIKRTIITAIATVVLIALYFYGISRTGADVKMGLVAVIAALAVYIAVSPLMYVRQLRGKVEYAATDKRLVIINGAVKAVPYSGISAAALRTDSDGHSSLLCGPEAVKDDPTKWRSDAALGVRTNTETGLCDSLVMYAVTEPDKLRQAIAPYLKLK